MDPHGTYHSALHALNLALQLTQGLGVAIGVTELLWDQLPDPGDDPGEVLAGLLEGVGLEVQTATVDAAGLSAYLTAVCRAGNLVYVLLRYSWATEEARWAVVTGTSGTQVRYAVCLQAGDPGERYRDLPDALVGPAIMASGFPPDGPKVVAKLLGEGELDPALN